MTFRGLPAGRQAERDGHKRVKGGVRIQRNRYLNPWPQADEGFRYWPVRKRSERIVWMPPGSYQRNACTESFSMSLQLNSVFRNKIPLMAATGHHFQSPWKCAKRILLGRLDYLKENPTLFVFSTYLPISPSSPALFRCR